MLATSSSSSGFDWLHQVFSPVDVTNWTVLRRSAAVPHSLASSVVSKDIKLSKIFKRNTIKVSYSCLPNVKQTISNNNHRLLQLHRMKESTQDSKLCNCRQKSSCPLERKCLTKCVVYKATVTETTWNNQETYIGLTENKFKTRFNLHKSSFKLEHKRTSTTLSDHVWKLKKKNINLNSRWSKE